MRAYFPFCGGACGEVGATAAFLLILSHSSVALSYLSALWRAIPRDSEKKHPQRHLEESRKTMGTLALQLVGVCTVALGDGATILHATSLYGVVGDHVKPLVLDDSRANHVAPPISLPFATRQHTPK